MKKNILILSTYFLILILLSGCVTTYENRSSSTTKELSVSSILRFNDIPIPMGFSALDQESFTFQNDVNRVALIKYIGSKRVDIVVDFYKDQMPMYGWNPINIIEYDRRILNYEKNQETCLVTIEARGRKSIVIIAIAPKSRPMKVEKK